MAVALLAAGCGGEASNPLLPGNAVKVIAFVNGASGNLDILVFDLDNASYFATPNLNSVTNDDANPSISSDGGKLVWQSDRPGGAGGFDLYQYDLNAQQALPALALNSASDETQPAWTGDGMRIAFTRDTLGFKRIRLFDPGAGAYVPLPGLDTTATFNDWSPSTNQDGSLIAFVSDRAGTPDVYLYDATVAVPAIRTFAALQSDSVDSEPSLTPSGQWLTFESNRAGGQGGYDIYIFNLFTSLMSTPHASLNSPENDRNPTISADGGVISLESDRPGGVGQIDIWNHDRVGGATGQSPGQGTLLDDLQPSLSWR
jgi:Tol biopolymer transport system component